MAYNQSPFAAMAGYGALPFGSPSAAEHSSEAHAAAAALVALGQQSNKQRAMTCGFNPCSGTAAAGVAAAGSLPLHMDLDALLAAASCKPGYATGAADDSCRAAAPARRTSFQAATAAAEAATKAAAVSGVLQEFGALPIASGAAEGIADAALGAIAESGLADTFYIFDLGEVARLHATWVATMPRVAPFYAVKCNPEPGIIAMLNALGAGFDCASIQELKCAAAHNVPQNRVIFANPCKRPADFRYARENGVEYTTFDCASELEKIAAGYPAFKCVLRIRCDDAEAKINLGLKYGADMDDVPMLLGMAKSMGLQVVGVSFHVGSGCQNVGVYADAISAARQTFDIAASYGFAMELLDIGGGFTAPYDEVTGRLFYQTAGVINDALERYFPPGCGVRVIAEPGRYFAETSATLFTTILGQRASRCSDGQPFRDYWLSDGTYGSFRIQVAVDGLEPSYSVLRSPLLPAPTTEQDSSLLHCRLWGNSDRDGDVVHKAALLPTLRDGDWLMFPYAGAYTICAASNYGGVCFTRPLKIFVYSSEAVREFGGFDVAAAALAAAATGVNGAAAAAAAAAGPAGVGVRVGSMSESCSDDSMTGCCEQLLPCVELLQALEFSNDNKGDATNGLDSDNSTVEVCDFAGLSKMGSQLPADMGSCLDLESLDEQQRCRSASQAAPAGKLCGMAAATVEEVGVDVADGSVLLPAVGSADNFDCMSVASEATGCGAGLAVGGTVAAVESEMGEVSSVAV